MCKYYGNKDEWNIIDNKLYVILGKTKAILFGSNRKLNKQNEFNFKNFIDRKNYMNAKFSDVDSTEHFNCAWQLASNVSF
jgi:hypothetical protein